MVPTTKAIRTPSPPLSHAVHTGSFPPGNYKNCSYNLTHSNGYENPCYGHFSRHPLQRQRTETLPQTKIISIKNNTGGPGPRSRVAVIGLATSIQKQRHYQLPKWKIKVLNVVPKYRKQGDEALGMAGS